MSFTKISEQKPAIQSRYTEKITSLLQTSDFTWIGREDGIVDFHSGTLKGSAKVFEVSFDCLESEDIKERINAMAVLEDGGVSSTLYGANERSIKLIQIRNDASTKSLCAGEYSSNFRITEKKYCQNIHSYILNSISINSSKEYLISADYLKINLWSPHHMDCFYNLVDIKSQLTGGAVFVINSCKFSPFSDTSFGYSTSNGFLKINDMSQAPKSEEVISFKNENTESIKSISDFSFLDQNMLISRSMNNLSVFDMRNPKSTVFSKDLIKNPSELNELNTGEAIYDKFKISTFNDTAYTGSYFGSVYSLNLLSTEIEEIQVSEKREYSIENKIKMITCNERGFSCVLGGKLVEYSLEKQ